MIQGMILACAVCFGDPNSPLTKSVVPAVLFLLGVVSLVLIWIAAWAVIWTRRARKLLVVQGDAAGFLDPKAQLH